MACFVVPFRGGARQPISYRLGAAPLPFSRSADARSSDDFIVLKRYPAMSIEVSNEACAASFLGTFALKIAAMEAAAKSAGVGGRLKYVTGTYLGITTASAKCPGSPNTTVALLKEIAATGLCSQVQLDTHITPGTEGNNNPGLGMVASGLQRMAERVGCDGVRLVILEENKCSAHFDRVRVATLCSPLPRLLPTHCCYCHIHIHARTHTHVQTIMNTPPPLYSLVFPCNPFLSLDLGGLVACAEMCSMITSGVGQRWCSLPRPIDSDNRGCSDIAVLDSSGACRWLWRRHVHTMPNNTVLYQLYTAEGTAMHAVPNGTCPLRLLTCARRVTSSQATSM